MSLSLRGKFHTSKKGIAKIIEKAVDFGPRLFVLPMKGL